MTQSNMTRPADALYTELIFPGNFLPEIQIPNLVPFRSMYDRARILRSTIVVTFTNGENSSKDVGVTQLPLGALSNAVPSSSVFLAEQTRTRSKYLTPVVGSFSRCKIVMSGNTRTAYGDSTNSTSGGDILTTDAMNVAPTTPWRWSVWTQDNIDTATAEDIGTDMKVSIYYTIEFLMRQRTTS